MAVEIDTDGIISAGDSAVEGGKDRTAAIGVESSRGDTRSSTTNILSGFNHRMAPLITAPNRDRVGYTFFTRPDFNFSEQNINASRRLSEIMRGGLASQAVAIMAMLDPMNPLFNLNVSSKKLGCRLHPKIGFDNRQAFIPMLSNLLISLTGFPDSTLDVYVSDEGIMREQWAMVDSTYQQNGAYSLNASFRNIDGDPITTYLTLYAEYMSGVRLGTFIPRASNMIRRRIDYQSRIYRFIMDPTNQYIRKYGIANAVFPVNDAMGAAMNVNQGPTYGTDLDVISVQYQAVGAYYMDPIILEEFNRVVEMFNPDMIPVSYDTSVYMPKGEDLVKLKRDEIRFFNYYGYPHINTNTYELEWWIYESQRAAMIKMFGY